MSIEVKFPLAEEGDKWFLSHIFIEVEEDGMVAIGLTKRNGDAYAYTRITKEQLYATLDVLGLFDEEESK